MFHVGGVSGIAAADPIIPDTGEAVHVKLYVGAPELEEAGTTGGGVIVAPPAVPIGPGGSGDEVGEPVQGFFTYIF